MSRRPRWRWWAALGGLVLAVGALPAAARPDQKIEGPPLVVEVAYGDSLWTIAREHSDPRWDVREVVAAIREANGVDAGRLQPGARVAIPGKYVAGGR